MLGFDKEAGWIWLTGKTPRRNCHGEFRKLFTLSGRLLSGEVAVYADSVYRLSVNGKWIGDGPSRSYPEHPVYDRYDVLAALKPGENEIRCLVTSYGESTFQYDFNPDSPSQGGLLLTFQGEGEDGEISFSTGKDWQGRIAPGFRSAVPRISCQMGFEEQYDAREEELNIPWHPVRVVCAAERGPWEDLSPRSVAHFTSDKQNLPRLLRSREVMAPGHIYNIEIKRALMPDDGTSNMISYKALLMGEFWSETEGPASLAPAYSFPGPWFLNGGLVEYTGKKACHVELQKGLNRLVIPLVADRHEGDVTISLDGAEIRESPLWALFDFRDMPGNLPEAAQAMSRDGAKPWNDRIVPVDLKDFTSERDIWNRVFGQRVLREQADVEELEDGGIKVNASGEDVELLFDYGREVLGYTQFRVTAPEGVRLDFYYGEALWKEEIQPTWRNRISLGYTCREGGQTYFSRQRRGFRYLSVTIRRGRGGDVLLYPPEVLLSTYPVENRGEFSSSDPLLNRIWETARYTMRLCMEDVFTDCPAYEQTYWVGDGRIEGAVSAVLFGAWDIFRRSLVLPAESYSRNPLLRSQVPGGWDNVIPAWSLIWIQMIENYYHYTGDRDTVSSQYSVARDVLENYLNLCDNPYGLLKVSAWNFFDWAPIDYNHAIVAYNSLFLYEALRVGIALAELEDDASRAGRWAAKREKLGESFREHFWSGERELFCDSIHENGSRSGSFSQQVNTLALLYGIAGEGQKASLEKILLAPPEGVVRFGTPFALFFLLEALASSGHMEEALAVIREKWGGMLEGGDATFWESFPGFEPEYPTRSYCHGWSSSPAYFLSTYILGIRPMAPGYESVRIAPLPAGGLNRIAGSVPTPRGNISVNLVRDEERFSLRIEKPAGMGGVAVLPEGFKQDFFSGNEYPLRPSETLIFIEGALL
ncbi:MAG: family 78 glycoside hydrolase catalytic domain [Spirochaetales bacterium]|nr:family 78 glycoside hydrolase catalytic domain [Spirochaetales bacterium]